MSQSKDYYQYSLLSLDRTSNSQVTEPLKEEILNGNVHSINDIVFGFDD